MARLTLLCGLLTCLWPVLRPVLPFVLAVQDTAPDQWPLHDDGLSNVVQWDHYSVLVNGRRVFLFGGEWHYWRIPVPELWRDILEKVKAAGFTTFTFYAHWGYHAPNTSTVDFITGAHDFTPLFTIAKELGLYVLVRPGPYVNAETNAGGFPLWVTTGAYGQLRNNDSRYTEAWLPYFSQGSKIVSEYLVTRSGNGLLFQIENEYGDQWVGNPDEKIANPVAASYMALLEATARENGVDCPLTFNNPSISSYSWSKDFAPNAEGDVDISGVDSYPSCWTCDLSQCYGNAGDYVAYQVVDYYNWFTTTSPTQPSFLPEFQGGSFNPWGGPQGGCPQDISQDFANLFYRHNIGEGVTAMSLYMLYGGTNWGSFAAPVVGTSYDYSSPISESRGLTAKYSETKLLALMTRCSHDLTMTDRIENTHSTNATTNSAIRVTELRNPLTNGAFYVTIHATSSSNTLETFKLYVNTSAGALTIPQQAAPIALNGHQSKIIVTDYNFGNQTLLYSTAEVLTYSILDEVPVLVLWVPAGEGVEFSVKDSKTVTLMSCQGCSNVTRTANTHGVIVSMTQNDGMTILQLETGVRVIVVDRSTAYTVWAPTLTADPFAPENETVLAFGPYLVRGASIEQKVVSLTGDIPAATTIEVFAPATVKKISWNGQAILAIETNYGSLVGSLVGPINNSVTLPALTTWKVKDSLPERQMDYDDTGPAWVVANHTTTPNPTKPDTLPVLYVDDYGFHNGISLYRSFFNGTASGVFLSIQGGTAFGWSAWLNGVFIGSFLGSAAVETGNLTLSFANATIHLKKKNLLFIIQDNNGHDETSGALNPRGILSASLINATGKFTSWKIAGTAGGDDLQIDPVRGPLSEGGLHAERTGWTLPLFDDNSWADGSPREGITGAGVNFYRTVVPLNIPAGLDVSLSFVLNALASQAVRVQLFVNGYQYGRFNPWIGHQIEFPVPPGILNYKGKNTLGLAVWAQTEQGAKVGIEWKVNYVLDSSFDVRFDGSYLRPGWTSVRHQYR